MQLAKKAVKVTAIMIDKSGARTYATFKMQPEQPVIMFEGREYAWTGERNTSGYLVMKEVT